jgi:hypothetical protein
MYGYSYQYGRILGKGGGGGGGFDADYQAVLDYGTAQGYTLPSGGQQTLQNDLLVALKADGVWSLLDLFYLPATDGDKDFASINWINPSAGFNFISINSPTFTSNVGFKGDATSAYLNTNFQTVTNGVNYTQNNAAIGGYFEPPTNSRNYFGSNFSIYNTIRNFGVPNNVKINTSDSILTSTGINNYDGFSSLLRTSSNTFKVINGVAVDTNTSTTSNFSDARMFIFRQFGEYSDAICKCFYLGANTEAVHLDFKTDIENYLTSI